LFHAGIVPLQFSVVEREEIVAREKGLGGFGKVLHRVGHGVDALARVGAAISERTLDFVIAEELNRSARNRRFQPSVQGLR
jgi:hypothetical protein